VHRRDGLAESGDPALAPHVLRLCIDADPQVRNCAANMGFCPAAIPSAIRVAQLEWNDSQW